MYLYVIAAANGLFKIGKSASPKKRLKSIGSHSPIDVELLFAVEYDDAITNLELWFHDRFNHRRIRGEWFALTANDLFEMIEQLDGDIDNQLVTTIQEIDMWGFFKLSEVYLSSKISEVVMLRISVRQNIKLNLTHSDLACNDSLHIWREFHEVIGIN